MVKSKEIVLGVTGSIAAYKSCDLVRRLQDKGMGVSVVMTKGAQEFVTPLTFASLSGRKVYTELFEKDNHSWQMNHIALRTAGLVVVAPATANIIGKMANGIADDLLTCVVLATTAPILVAPAMNDEMYKNKIVQDNIAKLKKFGVHFVDPIKGKLACGTHDVGHLAEVEDIVAAAIRLLK